jgi:hypothetical protein
MVTLTPSSYLTLLPSFEPADHHFTGPPFAQQSEGHGSVFHEEGRILAKLAHLHGAPVLELGSDIGISTRYLLDGLTSRDETPLAPSIYAVDTLHKWDSAIYSPLIQQFHTSSWTFCSPSPCPFCFIDADHSYDAVVKDISTALLCGARTLCFHDAGPASIYPVRQAILDSPLLSHWDVSDIQTRLGLIVATCPK